MPVVAEQANAEQHGSPCTPNNALAPASSTTGARETVSNVTHGLSALLKVVQFGVNAGFYIAKESTKAGVAITKEIVHQVGIATDSKVATDGIKQTLAVGQFFALKGIELGHFWTDFGLGAAELGVDGVENTMGNNDTALALQEFSLLLQREFKANGVAEIGTLRILKALVQWMNLQTAAKLLWKQEMKASCVPIDMDQHSLADESFEVVSSQTDLVVLSINALETTACNPPSLADDLQRYMRFAMGAYGRFAVDFMTNGTIDLSSTFGRFLDNPEKPLHDHHHFATYTEMTPESIIHSKTHKGSRYTPSFFVLIDHIQSQVIVSLRGTLSFHDLMVDLTCDPVEFIYDSKSMSAHGGMLQAAKSISKSGNHSRVFEAVSEALLKNPGYGVLLTGHSLGAGIASFLAVLWAGADGRTLPSSGLPAGRSLRCFAFACPQVFSHELSLATQSFITSFCVEMDCIPRLGLAAVQDLMQVILHVNEHGIAYTSPSEALEKQREITRMCMKSQKLFPAGRMLWWCDGLQQVDNPDRVYGQLLLDANMMCDHMPARCEMVINQEI